ncbi:MAG: hypothetical protein HYY01_09845 [Chloroflexi bacterium]|nr:hypothetical protein [Chloroflexota bacterium]
MRQPASLNELYRIRARFRRSVNIAADFAAEESLRGYIVTPLTRDVLRRVVSGLRPESQQRAWSIIGPYGTGKSACALFLARCLGRPKDIWARKLLRAADGQLYDDVCASIPGYADGGFFVTLLVGSRAPLADAALGALASSLASADWQGERFEAVRGRVNQLCERARKGESISNDEVGEAFEDAAHVVRGQGGLGLVLIVDELGKLLEHAALTPGQGDVFLLQILAEKASRSGDCPLVLIGILHQAFEQYSARLGPAQQREWRKIEGRFESVGFMESPGEFLKLIAAAVEPAKDMDGLGRVVESEAAIAATLNISPRDLAKDEAPKVLEDCAPLHPTVALVIGRLFRSKLAQNERSLFAFLTSDEPHGLQDFLEHETWDGDGYRPFFRLHHLYDYVVSSLGSGLYAHGQGKRWAEIEDALERLPIDAPSVMAQTVKTIGMLSLLGDQGRLKASREVLVFALTDGRRVTERDVEISLEQLVALKIAVFRRHKDAFGLWEGSDVDLDDWFDRAVGQIDQSVSLASLVERYGVLRPYVAKRHLHETGTLRYFVPWLTDPDHLDETLMRPVGNADGAIVFVIGDEGGDIGQMCELAAQATARLAPPQDQIVLCAVPKDTWELRQALNDVLAWRWVAENSHDLEGDRIALRELTGRRADARSRLNAICGRIFDRSVGHETSLWVHRGRSLNLRTAADLSATLSQACDEAYRACPIVHNELVNRRSLSSAAAAARRVLIERMITRTSEPQLGIEGFPPELSMYRSVLERSGLHRRVGPSWGFGWPPEDDPCHMAPLWRGIEAFLNEGSGRRRSIPELFALLRQPPYGIKDGLLPLFLTAALLCWQDEIALYENGSFLPQLETAAIERLIRSPEHFDIQHYRLGEVRSFLLEQYSTLATVNAASGSGQVSALRAVRSMIALLKQLPPYSMATRTVGGEAAAVRDELLRAREPSRLLFESLPVALGMDSAKVSEDRGTAEAFFRQLKRALVELLRAYQVLTDRVREQLLDALRLPEYVGAARKEIAGRLAPLRDRVTDLRLKAFVLRLADERLPEQEWLESVASLVANKPPRQWNDQDSLQFGMVLAGLAGQLLKVEQIVAEHKSNTDEKDGARVLMLEVAGETGEDYARVVRIGPNEESDVATIVGALEMQLSRMAVSARMREAVVAELVRRTLGATMGVQEPVEKQ